MVESTTKRELTCIVCPRGCPLTVTLACGRVTEVVGNACKRGKEYAENECTYPVRTVTSTVRCEDGSVVPVKTSTPIPKELVGEIMKALCTLRAPADARISDTLVSDILGTGAHIVVTGKHSK